MSTRQDANTVLGTPYYISPEMVTIIYNSVIFGIRFKYALSIVFNGVDYAGFRDSLETITHVKRQLLSLTVLLVFVAILIRVFTVLVKYSSTDYVAKHFCTFTNSLD